jgi:hypothetical protein
MTKTRDTVNGGAAASEGLIMATEPMVAAYKAYFLDLPLTMTSETLRFAGHRLEEQAKLLASFSACKTLSDLAEAQSHFVQGALGDYRKEAGALVHRAREVVGEALS